MTAVEHRKVADNNATGKNFKCHVKDEEECILQNSKKKKY